MTTLLICPLSAMTDAKWPPALKSFVNETFAKCTDANRAAVEKELKAAIFNAFNTNTLWTIDWPNFKLESLKPKVKRKKPDPAFQTSTLYQPAVENQLRNKRVKRFGLDNLGAVNSPTSDHGLLPVGQSAAATPEPDYNPDVIDWDRYTIVGTSQNLEKPYLRLTSVPDPANVRPLPILRQTLEHLKKRWRAENNYNHTCDQFKSLRQDLTVQRIKNDFTVQVYEIHARIALEKGDLGEYNQCQSQLQTLYDYGLKGRREEFLAYRILYLLHTRNRRDVNTMLAKLTAAERQDESVSHALQVRLALATSNYYRFFRLFDAAPKMAAYLMDHFLARERVTALVVMSKAYMTLPLAFITKQLAFENAEDAHQFLAGHLAAIYQPLDPTQARKANRDNAEDPRQVDCRLIRTQLAASLDNYKRVDIKGQI